MRHLGQYNRCKQNENKKRDKFTKLQLTFQDFAGPSRIVALTTKNNDGVFNNHSGMIEPSLAEKIIVGALGEGESKSDILVYNSTSEYNSQSGVEWNLSQIFILMPLNQESKND